VREARWLQAFAPTPAAVVERANVPTFDADLVGPISTVGGTAGKVEAR